MKKTIKNIAKTLSAGFAAAVLFAGCNNTENLMEVYPSDWSEGVMATSAWIMAGCGTSGTVASDSLHIGYSTDGLTWTALNSNKGIYTPTIGSRHIRDPFIFRMNDGSFVLLATDYTADGAHTDFGAGEDTDYGNNPSNKLYVAFSEDLINWKYEHLLQVKSSSGKYGCIYPRAMYNKTDRCYDIYFTGDEGDGVQKTYLVQTWDFLTLKDDTLHVLFNPTHSVSQSLVVKGDDAYYLFCRDTRAYTGTDEDTLATNLGGDIQCAKVRSLDNEQFSFIGSSTESLTGNVEDYYINRGENQNVNLWQSEPCVYQLASGKWIMLVNEVTSSGSYSAYETSNISDSTSWTDCTSSITKYGSSQLIIGTTVTRITASELDALKAAF